MAGGALSIGTRDFLAALCASAPALPPPAPATARMWPAVAGAEAMLAEYDRLAANLPGKRRCLRPPPKAEPALEAAIAARWLPAVSAASSDSTAEEEAWEGVAGIYFSVPAAGQRSRAALVETLRALWASSAPAAAGPPSVACLPFVSAWATLHCPYPPPPAAALAARRNRRRIAVCIYFYSGTVLS